MYNPILGIYELKRFMGLKDLPRSDERVARILRYFNSKDEEVFVNVDEITLRFWENFLCAYSDCVFVDLNAHAQNHQFTLRGIGVDNEVNCVHIRLSFRLRIIKPIAIIENQITNTYDYMSQVLEHLVNSSFLDGAWKETTHFEALIRRNINLSSQVDKYFALTDLVVEMGFSSEVEDLTRHSFGHPIENDMNALLRIAMSSDLEKGEEERLKRLFLNYPRSL